MEKEKGFTNNQAVGIDVAADTLFSYLRDVIYNPSKASLNIVDLPQELHNFAKGLMFFAQNVMEANVLAKELAGGNLNSPLPSRGNEIAAPLKMLHASLKHLTWQTQQVAKGDYLQRVDFMGDFSEAFNNMVRQLGRRWQISLDEKTTLQKYVNLVLANCPDPILLFNREKCLAYASDSYLDYCKESIDAIIGNTVRKVFEPYVSDDFSDVVESLFEAAVNGKCTIAAERDIYFGKGVLPRHFQIQITPMVDASHNAEGVMIILHDTTQIENSRVEAEKARAVAERALLAKSDFLARMSHEMRTPMNAIIGMTTIYGNAHDFERKDYCVEKINEAAMHLLDVINDVLDMSKIEADKFELSSNPFNLRKMIDGALTRMRFKSDERKQTVSFSIADDVPATLIADETRLLQIINNLLSNAIKFTHEGGEISFSVTRANDFDNTNNIRFEMRDNGIGISDEQLSRLFIPFEQGDGGVARRFGGVGLGLVISKTIIEKMNGQIWVESKLGKGSAFIFELPLESETLEPSSDIPIFEQDDSFSDEGIFVGKRILFAEDVEINREIIIMLLEDTGIAIDTAINGLVAVEKFCADKKGYDLVLMDINMPVMDGYEATRQIRQSNHSKAKTVPIVAMTANVYSEDVERCLASGMNSHLGKPVDADELVRRLKSYLL